MSFIMKVPKSTMIGAVLATAIKTVLVSTFVRVRQLAVEPIVRTEAVVFVIVSKCRHYGYAQRQHGGRQERFS